MLGDDLAANLPLIRAEAESLMTDAAIIERVTGTTLDPDNGARVKVWSLVQESPARILRVQVQIRDQQAAGQSLTQATVEGRLPWHVSDLRLGDRVTLTTSGDPRLLGVPIVLTEVDHATHAVSRRWRGVVDEDRA